MKCGAELHPNEIGLHKKLVNRGSTEFMCMKCLSEFFKISIPDCEKLIKNFKEDGCHLFI